MTEMPREIWAIDQNVIGYEVEWFPFEIDGATKYTRTDTLPTWRPIAEAPRDGTRLLLDFCGTVVMGQWNAQKHNKNPNPYWDSDRDFLGVLWHRANQPTHFIALSDLPTPPRKDEK